MGVLPRKDGCLAKIGDNSLRDIHEGQLLKYRVGD
jgi:hypothetical protein